MSFRPISNVPQGLKPSVYAALCGTAKAVPFQGTGYARSGDSAKAVPFQSRFMQPVLVLRFGVEGEHLKRLELDGLGLAGAQVNGC